MLSLHKRFRLYAEGGFGDGAGSGGSGGGVGTGSGFGSDGYGGYGNGFGGGLTGYGEGFNAAKDSQAANESLGLGADGGFTGTVNLGLTGPTSESFTRLTTLQRALSFMQRATGVIGVATGNPVAIGISSALGAANSAIGLASDAGLSLGRDSPSAQSGTNSIGNDSDSGGFAGGGSGSGFASSGPTFEFPPAVSSAVINPLKPPMIAAPPGKMVVPEITPAVVSPPVATPLTAQPSGSSSLTDPSSGGVAKTTDWLAIATLVVSGAALFSGK